MFYYLCKNKRCYERLREEIDNMDKEGRLSSPIAFGEASRMPYLQACMKEAMRLHPAVGQMLERVVPEGGAQFGQHWLPPGTIVGINPWVVSRERTVYGDDVDDFRPERWLDVNTEAAKGMQRNFLAVSLLSHSIPIRNLVLTPLALSLDQEGAPVLGRIFLCLKCPKLFQNYCDTLILSYQAP
jgi:hypothetical protein